MCCSAFCCCVPCCLWGPVPTGPLPPVNTVTLSGVVYGTDTLPVGAGFPVQATIGGVTTSTVTDSTGRYTFQVPLRSNVVLVPQLAIGVQSSPPNYTIYETNQSFFAYNFYLSAI